MRQVHPIPPLCNHDSKILILGSFPSVKSREAGFFYGHPQNRFWQVTARIFEETVPQSIEEKKAFLLRQGIALWDVISACNIEGSSDSSITDVVPNDLDIILDNCNIRQLFVNGKTAEKLFHKHIQTKINRSAICLPSTSPANAAWSVERLAAEWSMIKDYV